jgi:hypothetical protein
MSTASIGVFFLVLTNEHSSSLDASQRMALYCAIGLLSLSVLFGVAAWLFAGLAYYKKAVRKDPTCKGAAHRIKFVCDVLLIATFLAGIGASARFLVLRVQSDASAPTEQVSSLGRTAGARTYRAA